MSTREIKFRCWHKERNKILDVFDVNFRTPATVQVLTDEYNLFDELLSCVELMQFTGLKDCNGIDIYEGDIISIFDFCDCDLMMVGVVKFGVNNYPAFDIYDKKGSTYSDEYNTFTNDNDLYLKVIGNIHQHPHLLGE